MISKQGPMAIWFGETEDCFLSWADGESRGGFHMDKRPTVGLVGAGIMGTPMGLHLIEAGYPVRAWNRSQEKLKPLLAAGAVGCGHAREVGERAAAVICMLSDGPTCDAVLFGDGAVAAGMEPGATIVVMSSIAVETAVEQGRRAAEFGVRYVDAPVSGRGNWGAECDFGHYGGRQRRGLCGSCPDSDGDGTARSRGAGWLRAIGETGESVDCGGGDCQRCGRSAACGTGRGLSGQGAGSTGGRVR